MTPENEYKGFVFFQVLTVLLPPPHFSWVVSSSLYELKDQEPFFFLL
jgi:hypothetical protein